MRRLLVLATVLSALVAWPAHAQAQTYSCYCQWFADQYTAKPNTFYRQVVSLGERSHGMKNEVDRDGVKAGIYDWQKKKAFNQAFCKRFPKICKAVKACLAAAALSVGKDVSEGDGAEQTMIDAAALCGIAAAAVYAGVA